MVSCRDTIPMEKHTSLFYSKLNNLHLISVSLGGWAVMVLLSARLNDGAANTRTTGALITKRFSGFRVITQNHLPRKIA